MHIEEQREDDIGRLTRAIPLYLAEAVHFWTSLKGHALIPIVRQGGPIVPGSESDDAELCNDFSEQSDFLLTGSIDTSTNVWLINWRLWDCKKGICVANEKVSATAETVGKAILNIEQRLLEHLERVS